MSARKRYRAAQAMRERLAAMTTEERRRLTEKARDAYRVQIERIVDPDGTMTSAELAEAVAAYRRAELRKHSARSATVRRERRDARAAARLEELRELAEAEVTR